jgi:hypothetical protein
MVVLLHGLIHRTALHAPCNNSVVCVVYSCFVHSFLCTLQWAFWHSTSQYLATMHRLQRLMVVSCSPHCEHALQMAKCIGQCFSWHSVSQYHARQHGHARMCSLTCPQWLHRIRRGLQKQALHLGSGYVVDLGAGELT